MGRQRGSAPAAKQAGGPGSVRAEPVPRGTSAESARGDLAILVHRSRDQAEGERMVAPPTPGSLRAPAGANAGRTEYDEPMTASRNSFAPRDTGTVLLVPVLPFASIIGLLGDHSAGNPIARVASGTCLAVVGLGVNHQGGAATGEDGMLIV